MIQESYITFEQAKALKELGFPWICTEHLYDKNGVFDGNLIDYPLYQCPTLSLVQKWLREEKDLFIAIEINSLSNVQYKKEIPYWTMNLYKFYHVAGQMMMLNGSGEDFETYEQALSAGIDRCIELLKQ